MAAEAEPRSLELRPVTGPSGLAGDVRRFLVLTRTLAVADFKLRFFGSVLGYLWQLMRPLMLFGVLYVVFTQFVEVSDQRHFPVALLLGIVLFTFFSEATSGAVGSVVERENLVRKIHFPRLAIPLSVVVTATFNLALNLIVVLAFGLALGIEPRWSWLELPLLLVVLVAYSAGLAALLAALFVRFRDMRPIWDVLLQVSFYGSMIIVPFHTVHDEYPLAAELLLINPLAAILQQARHAFVDPVDPNLPSAMGSDLLVLAPAFLVIASLAVGLWYFSRQAPRVAEDL